MATKTHCPRGHDIAIVGRVRSNGRCNECQRIGSREYKARNHALILERARLDRELNLRVFGRTHRPKEITTHDHMS